MVSPSTSELPTEIISPEASEESIKRVMTIQERETKPENEFLLAEEESDIVRRRWKAGPQETLVIITSAVMAMMLAFDVTMMISILPYFSTALHGNSTYTAWPEIGFLIAASVTQRFFVAVAEVVGHRYVLFAAVFSYAVGAVLCSAAFSFLFLIIGHCVRGLGAGGMIALILALMKDIVPSGPRPFYAGIIFGFGSIGAALGPIIGNVVLERTSWKTLFYIMIPLSGLVLLAIPWLSISSEELVEARQLLSIDWTGGLMFTGSLVSLLLGITWGGELYAWKSWRVILTVAAGGLGLLAALMYEKAGASQPFIQFRILKIAPAAYTCIFLNGIMMFLEIYSMQVYFKATKLLSPTEVAINLLPITVTVLPTTAIVGIITNHYGRFCWGCWAGSALTLLSSGCLMVLDVKSSPSTWILILLVAGFGHGMSLSALHSSAQTTVPNSSDIRGASSLDAFLRILGMVTGVSVGDVVFRSRLRYYLSRSELSKKTVEPAMSFLTGPLTASIASTDFPVVQHAYVDSFRNMAQVLMVVAAVGFVGALFIGRRGLVSR